MQQQEIKIEGKTYPVHPGMSTWRMFCTAMNYETFNEATDLFSKMGEIIGVELLDGIGNLILCGIKEGSRKAKSEIPELEVADIIDLFDDDQEELMRVMEAMAESLAKMNSKAGEKVKEEKK
jgi:hypothetical protein